MKAVILVSILATALSSLAFANAPTLACSIEGLSSAIKVELAYKVDGSEFALIEKTGTHTPSTITLREIQRTRTEFILVTDFSKLPLEITAVNRSNKNGTADIIFAKMTNSKDGSFVGSCQ